MKKLNRLLKSVSRSFYLSMRFLPELMRPGVSVAYLLARATDTVADSVDLATSDRRFLLLKMGELIEGNKVSQEEAVACYGRLGTLSRNQSHRGEAELLDRFPECLAQLEFLHADEQVLVRQVLAQIVQGQLWDLSYFDQQNRVSSPDMLDQYTYRVAGCVGEFWTKLGIRTLGIKFSTRPESELLLRGKHYGQGLQLVNILRDRRADEANGRIYLPDNDTASWLQLAETYLKEGLSYADTLKIGRLRFSCYLPARLGLDTLALISEDAQEAKVKVTRSRVYARMWEAFLYAWRHPTL